MNYFIHILDFLYLCLYAVYLGLVVGFSLGARHRSLQLLILQLIPTQQKKHTETPQISTNTGKLAYDRLNGTRKIGPSYAKP